MDWFYTDGLYSCLAPFPQRILVWKTHGSHTESLPFKVIGIRIVDNADFSDVNFAIHDVEKSAQIPCGIGDMSLIPLGVHTESMSANSTRIGPI